MTLPKLVLRRGIKGGKDRAESISNWISKSRVKEIHHKQRGTPLLSVNRPGGGKIGTEKRERLRIGKKGRWKGKMEKG